MRLPDQCTVEGDDLAFWEVADPATLADLEKIYEYACATACTSGLRPTGMASVETSDYPDLAEGETALWGRRSMTAESIGAFRAAGMVLATIRLPVAPMAGHQVRAVVDAGGAQPHPTPPTPFG
jgi:hypothetical protein